MTTRRNSPLLLVAGKHRFQYSFVRVFCQFLLLVVAGCSVKLGRDSGPPPGSIDVARIPDAVPKKEPKSRYGNPKSYVVMGKRYHVMDSSTGFVQRGIASWYGNKFHGRRTSSGETYDMYAMTAAHKTLPLPTYVRVTNLKNGRQVTVRVNDRGPFHDNRIIDLSYTAAAKLDIIKTGTGLVEVRAVGAGSEDKPAPGAPVRSVRTAGQEQAFYIQIGAFSRRIKADSFRNRLGVLGKTLVKISAASVNGNLVYRVRLGPIVDIEVADKLAAQLRKLGIDDYIIVID